MNRVYPVVKAEYRQAGDSDYNPTLIDEAFLAKSFCQVWNVEV